MKEYKRLYEYPYKLGTTIWGPLCSGILTGKYINNIPQDSRATNYDFVQQKWAKMKDKTIPILNKLDDYAKNTFDTTITCLAIAWIAKNKNISTILLGASKENQIEENLKALEIAKLLTPKHMQEIEDILQNKPSEESYWGRTLNPIVETQ